jgi:hypothetical protein
MERMDRPGEDDGGYPGEDPSSEEPGALLVDCQITSPANGDVKNGPQNGVTIIVEGTAKIASGTGTIERVEVQFGADPAEFETAENRSGSWSEWKASNLVTISGVVPITARAVVGGKPLGARTITVTTELTTTPSGDTTPPSVSITAPKGGAAVVVSASNPVETIEITGTSSDVGGGVAQVEVFVDGRSVTAAKVAGTWADWSARVSLVGIGEHTIKARAVDTQGLATTATVEVLATTEPVMPPVVERLLLVEKLRLSTYPSRLGLGEVFKTLTLLPGQEETITVKTYKRTTETATEASSILDETTDESQKEFESQLTLEQTNKRVVDESLNWHVSGQGNAEWGWGSASLSAGVAGATNAAREELTKNVANAVQKHAAKASSKRTVEVKSSREMKREEGEEFSSESHIENINVSRTMNILFSQANRELKTLLTVTGVRVAHVRGDLVQTESGEDIRYSYREVALSQLDGLLDQVIVAERREDVRRAIVAALTNAFDYKDEPHTLIEKRELHDAQGNPIGSYLRFPNTSQSYELNGRPIRVPGVILAEMTNVVRTDGIICDAVLGQRNALDAYSRGLQREAVEARAIENDRQREAVNRERLAIKLVQDSDVERAKVFKDVYPEPEQDSLALVTTSATSNGAPTNVPASGG